MAGMSLAAKKKGSVDVQFNWIFIIIAGALILLLFTTIVIKQKNSAQSAAQISALRSISSIIAGSESSVGITNTLELPEVTLQFECNRIRVERQATQFENLLLFSPSSVRTSPLIVKTEELAIPYRATNLVYLSSPKIRYAIVSRSELSEKLLKAMPEGLTTENPEQIDSLIPKNEDNLRLIFFNLGSASPPSLPPSFNEMNDRQISALVINGDSSGGSVKFYSKNGPSWNLLETLPYLHLETLLGAALTDSPSQYQCIIQNAFKRAKIVTSIYQEKTTRLIPKTHQRCAIHYAESQKSLNAISAQLSGFSDGGISAMISSEKELEEQNSALLRKSCPLIY